MVVHLPLDPHEYYHVVTGKLSVSIPTYIFLIKQVLSHNYYCNNKNVEVDEQFVLFSFTLTLLSVSLLSFDNIFFFIETENNI